ncbi:tetratricopeptide repeat protein [Acidobacteriota bacterium]
MNSPRLVHPLLIFALCLIAGVAHAGTFEGLEPGVSIKADADRVLGPPVREIVAGVRYDYDPSKYGARRISIQFDGQTQKIVKIDLHLDTHYAKSDYREWFEFGEPSSTRTDDDGNLVESYLPQAISLHYTGPDDGFQVAFFRHFDPGSGPQVTPTQPSGPTVDNLRSSQTKTFLGASFATNHEGQGVRIREVWPNAPADRAGVRPDDVILEFGQYTLYRSEFDPFEFVALIGTMPTGEPIRLVVERGTRRFELWAELELRDTKSIEVEGKRLAFEAYQRGEELFRLGRYEEAIGPLQSAYNFNNSDGRTLDLLGYCLLRKQRYAEALRAYNGALQRMPDSPTIKYFIGACHDALGDSKMAVDYYQQYLSSNDADKKKRKYANRRINAITNQPDESTDWNKALVDIIEAVRQEMDDGN